MLSTISVAPSWLWIGFIIGVVVLLVIDLSLFGKGDKAPSRKVALLENGPRTGAYQTWRHCRTTNQQPATWAIKKRRTIRLSFTWISQNKSHCFVKSDPFTAGFLAESIQSISIE